MNRILAMSVPISLMLLAAAAVSADDRPHWHTQDTPTAAQLRDVSVVDARIAWAAGDDGVVLRTTDGGRRWRPAGPDDASGMAFRDIEAFSSRSAVALSSGPGAASRIYRTDDGGHNWTLQYQGHDGQPPLACMGFWNGDQGVLLGEPRNGTYALRVTTDGGAHWKRMPRKDRPEALENERVLGSGQNCMATIGNGRATFAVGNGEQARVIASDDSLSGWRSVEMPHLARMQPGAIGMLLRGGQSGFAASGAASGATEGDAQTQLAALGDGRSLDRTALRRDGREHWIKVGVDGSVISDRSGTRSQPIGEASYTAVDGSANGVLVLAVGSDGRIAQLRW